MTLMRCSTFTHFIKMCRVCNLKVSKRFLANCYLIKQKDCSHLPASKIQLFSLVSFALFYLFTCLIWTLHSLMIFLRTSSRCHGMKNKSWRLIYSKKKRKKKKLIRAKFKQFWVCAFPQAVIVAPPILHLSCSVIFVTGSCQCSNLLLGFPSDSLRKAQCCFFQASPWVERSQLHKSQR